MHRLEEIERQSDSLKVGKGLDLPVTQQSSCNDRIS